MGYEAVYTRDEIAGPVVVYVPLTTVPVTSSIGVSPTHVPAWVHVSNVGAADLVVGSSEAAVQAGVGVYLPAGASITIQGAGGLHAHNPSATIAGAITYAIGLSRRPYDVPSLTAAEGFPTYNGGNPAAIIPGVE